MHIGLPLPPPLFFGSWDQKKYMVKFKDVPLSNCDNFILFPILRVSANYSL